MTIQTFQCSCSHSQFISHQSRAPPTEKPLGVDLGRFCQGLCSQLLFKLLRATHCTVSFFDFATLSATSAFKGDTYHV
jgi:hypothetical protein